MTKFYYIAHLRLPTWRAHGIQIMKTCEALVKMGTEVELVATQLNYGLEQDYFKYYGVEKNFKITRLWCPDTARFGYLGFWLGLMIFSLSALWYLLPKKGIFYTRDEFTATLFRSSGKKVVWEAHTGQKNIFVKIILTMQVPVIAISNGLKQLYVSMGVDKEKILVAPDGVSIEQFNLNLEKSAVRKELGLPQEKKLIIYTGSRYKWKGVDVLEEVNPMLPEGVELIVVTDKSYLEIPKYLQAADVLVLPNSAKSEVSRQYTSPMKLFEYMASGRPIIASDLPSIREVLDDKVAYLFKPDSSRDLAQTIKYVLNYSEEVSVKALLALERVKEYTWEKRASKILEFVN